MDVILITSTSAATPVTALIPCTGTGGGKRSLNEDRELYAMSIRRKARLLVPLAAAAAALAAASTAWACTTFNGETWFAGGVKGASATNNNSITGIYADSVPSGVGYPTSGWKIVASDGECCGVGYSPMSASTFSFTQSGTPQIGPVTGTAPGQDGLYQVCFLHEGTGKATGSATLTVT